MMHLLAPRSPGKPSSGLTLCGIPSKDKSIMYGAPQVRANFEAPKLPVPDGVCPQCWGDSWYGTSTTT